MATDTCITQRDNRNDLKEKQGNQVVRERRQEMTFVPNVDIIEEQNRYLIVADVPGSDADHIELNLEDGQLTIEAKVPCRSNEAGGGWLLREYGVGDFRRSFRFGEGIDAERIEAQVNNGVLTVSVPKHESMRPRKIAVKHA